MILKKPFKDYYNPSDELLAAINTALFLKRPLLLAGDPGTGKTECADFIARQLSEQYSKMFISDKALRFNTKSISQSTDLFYSYDAVAHFADKTYKKKESFISFNCLGVGLLGTNERKEEWLGFNNYESEIFNKPLHGSVVLIDEIDKAPRDFPNDLLAELEKPPFKFRIHELPDFEIIQNVKFPIVIIITSNNEKGLPDAFLRRCVFHYINFPEKDLLQIVQSNLEKENVEIVHAHISAAIKIFLKLRNNSLEKKPATSELIDWIRCLNENDLLTDDKLSKWESEPGYKDTIGIIAKSENDLKTLGNQFAK